MGNPFQLPRLILQWIPAGKMIVPEVSATLGYPGESRHGLNGNHLTITKYSSKKDPDFATIATELHKLVTAIVNEPEALPAAQEALYNPKRGKLLIAEVQPNLDVQRFL